MVKEKVLNAFISSNMPLLGLHHVNSEVPKVVAERVGKRADILGYDIETRVPIVLELKVKKDPRVVGQLHEYIAVISKMYPRLFEELNAFRHVKGFRFNYEQGIVGMVLSPEPPPESKVDRGSTILWAQFSLHSDEVFRIVDRKLLSKSTGLTNLFLNLQPFDEVPPSQFVALSLPGLREFADRLNETYLSVSPTISPRSKYEHSYIAYYGTDTSRVVFGFNTGATRSHFDVEFSVLEEDHDKFKSNPATRKLNALGLQMELQRKNQIFSIRVYERFAADDNKVSHALALFKEMAELSYSLAKLPELQHLRIDPAPKGALALEHFGLS
jgi:hypothetical protein